MMNWIPLKHIRRSLFLVLVALLFSTSLQAAELEVATISHDGPVDFEKEILPLFTRNCMACHSGSKAEGDLVLETPQSILKGGAQGPTVVPEKPDESLLMAVITHRDEPVMPPVDNGVGAKNLTPAELGLVQRWIAEGAKGMVGGGKSPIVWQLPPQDVNPIYATAMTVDGKWAAAGRANQIDVYSIPGKKLIARLVDDKLTSLPEAKGRTRAHLDIVESLVFSPDGEWLVSGSLREIKFWKRPNEIVKSDFAKGVGVVTSIVVSPDRSLIAMGEDSGLVRVYETQSRKEKFAVPAHQGIVGGLAFSPDGTVLVTGGRDQVIRVLSSVDGHSLSAMTVPGAVSAVAVTDDLKSIVVGTKAGAIQLFDFPKPVQTISDPLPIGIVLKEIPPNGFSVTSLTLSNRAGSQLVSTSLDGNARLWEIATFTQLKFMNHGAPITTSSVLRDGSRLATGAENGGVKLWDLENGELLAEVSEQPERLARIEKEKFDVALAQREGTNALSDVAASTAKLKEAQDAVDVGMLETATAENTLEAKTAAHATQQTASETAAQALVDGKAELVTAEATLKELEAGPPGEEDTAKAAHAEKQKTAQSAIEEAKKKVTAAEQQVTKAAAAATRAGDEKGVAALSLEASKRTLQKQTEAVQQLSEELTQLLTRVTERNVLTRQTQFRLAEAESVLRLETQLVSDLRQDRSGLDQTLFQFRTQLNTTLATEEEKKASNAPETEERAAAVKEVMTAEETWRKARTELRYGAEQSQLKIYGLTLDEIQLEKSIQEITARKQASAGALDAVTKALAETEKKEEAEKEAPAKKLLKVEVENSRRRKAFLDGEIQVADSALGKLIAAKTELTAQLQAARMEATQLSEAAQTRVNETFTALNASREKLSQLDRASGGTLTLLKRGKESLRQLNQLLAAKSPPVRWLTFSPDGGRLVVSRSDGIRIYSGNDGSSLGTGLLETGDNPMGVFLNDRNLLVADAKQNLQSIDLLPPWKLAREIGGINSESEFMGPVTALDFSPDGMILASGGGDPSRLGELKFWDAATGALIRSIENSHSDLVVGVQFSPDGRSLASCGADRRLNVFLVETGELVKSFEGHGNHVLGVSWRADGRMLVSASADKTCKVWSMEKSDPVQSLTGYSRDVSSVQFLGVTDQFVTASGATKQVMIRGTDGSNGAVFPGTSDFIYSVRAGRDGKIIIAGGQDSVLHVWNEQGKPIATFPPPTMPLLDAR